LVAEDAPHFGAAAICQHRALGLPHAVRENVFEKLEVGLHGSEVSDRAAQSASFALVFFHVLKVGLNTSSVVRTG